MGEPGDLAKAGTATCWPDAATAAQAWKDRVAFVLSLPAEERQRLRDECAAWGQHVKSGEYFATHPPRHTCAHCLEAFFTVGGR